jgi:hypothetical protein
MCRKGLFVEHYAALAGIDKIGSLCAAEAHGREFSMN